MALKTEKPKARSRHPYRKHTNLRRFPPPTPTATSRWLTGQFLESKSKQATTTTKTKKGARVGLSGLAQPAVAATKPQGNV